MIESADERFWRRCEELIGRDPAQRGLASYRHRGERLGQGALRRGAESLASGRSVAIVTGFCVVEHQPPVAETDGPTGSLYLAAAAQRLGLRVVLVSDVFGVPLLAAGTEHFGLPPDCVVEYPFDDPGSFARSDAWNAEFLDRHWTHLVAIERVGPSHTAASLAAQPREGPVPVEAFEAAVPEDDRDKCHNIRGRVIDEHTAPTHRLFEAAAAHTQPPATIAALDGGNELGSGALAWEVLCRAITRGQPARVACRVPVDAPIVAGVSDWGGYALALATAHVLGRAHELGDLDVASQRRLIETIVERTGAVDGVTGLAQPTVDGLPLETYLATLTGLREATGLRV